MCGDCKNGICKGGCIVGAITKILVIIGGVNWGLIGLGVILGGKDWNVVKMIFGSLPTLEAIVYLLVGISAIVMIFGCNCGKCKEICSIEEKKEETPIQQ